MTCSSLKPEGMAYKKGDIFILVIIPNYQANLEMQFYFLEFFGNYDKKNRDLLKVLEYIRNTAENKL